MRVLIIAANQEHKPDPVVPLGAAFVAGAARQAGHDVCFADACFEGDGFLARLNQHLQFRPEVIGLSLRNIDDIAWPRANSYVPWYRKLVATIREQAALAKLVLGGSAFTLMPGVLMSELRPDFGIAGAGEEAFVALLRDIERDYATPIQAPRLISAMPSGSSRVRPALDLIDLPLYYKRGGALNVQTKRGCPFQCSYCTYPLLEGSAVWTRNLEDAVDDMKRMRDSLGVQHFFIVDNTFNTPEVHARAFCEELIRRELSVQWTAYVTPRGLGVDLCQLMARSGCTSVELGTDAGASATLRGLGKGFDPHEITAACEALRLAGIRFSHSLILGGPGETPQTLEETATLIAATRADFVVGMLGVRLYPGTRIAHDLERAGELREGEVGLEPVFYVAPAVQETLIAFAKRVSDRFGWYFPGLEGDRWLRYWRRLRAHGVRGPLWIQQGVGAKEAGPTLD